MPFITGMLMSRKTKSGFRSTTFSMASFPSSASPHTWKEWPSRNDRIAVRVNTWSSTIRIRAGNYTPIIHEQAIEGTAASERMLALLPCLLNTGLSLVQEQNHPSLEKRDYRK